MFNSYTLDFNLDILSSSAFPDLGNSIPALLASSSNDSMKFKFSIFPIKWITFPPTPHPKQWNICLSGETQNEGDFSLWNGHSPM